MTLGQSVAIRYWLVEPDGTVILGPFESQELAIKVRAYVEKVRGREDVWALDDADLERHRRTVERERSRA